MSINDCFCPLPFTAIDVHNGRRKPCCMNKSESWKTNQTIQQYWYSQELKNLRNNLLNNQADPSCNRCWYLEKNNQVSMRQSVLKSRLPELIDTQNPKIQQVKLITGKSCNLSCMMCFDTISSTYKDIWKNDPTWVMPVNKSIDREYDSEIDSYIRQNAQNLLYIEVLGGEPLFEKRYLSLLEFLIESGTGQHLTLFTITNGSIFTAKMIELFSKFKKSIFAVSVDGVGLVNDYQRWPSKWSLIESNLEKINDNFDMSILPTVTALNICHLPELVTYCEQKKYVLNNFVLVDDWPQLLPCNLPDEIKSKISHDYRFLLDGEANQEQLLKFIKRWDHQRNIKIGNFMPEWLGIITY